MSAGSKLNYTTTAWVRLESKTAGINVKREHHTFGLSRKWDYFKWNGYFFAFVYVRAIGPSL